MVLSYIKANPLRAGLVTKKAQDWRWSSVGVSASCEATGLLDPWPLDRPQNWLELVNDAVSDTELQSLRTGRPYD
jgi:hypothetical protein